jgi:hypothetical protein
VHNKTAIQATKNTDRNEIVGNMNMLVGSIAELTFFSLFFTPQIKI